MRRTIRLQQILNAQTIGQKRKFQHDISADDLPSAWIEKDGP